MTLDDYPLDEDMLAFCKAAIDAMPDALLITGARKMQDLFKGAYSGERDRRFR